VLTRLGSAYGRPADAGKHAQQRRPRLAQPAHRPHLRTSAEYATPPTAFCCANRLWGTERIRGELLKLGIIVSKRSIRRYRWRGPGPSPSQSLRTFLANHAYHLWAADLFTVTMLTFKTLYVLVCIAHCRRELVHVNVTTQPEGRLGPAPADRGDTEGNQSAPPAARSGCSLRS
jgi:hypothetical protein